MNGAATAAFRELPISKMRHESTTRLLGGMKIQVNDFSCGLSHLSNYAIQEKTAPGDVDFWRYRDKISRRR